jgi:hypothetical protein
VWSFSNVLASQHSTSVDTPPIGRTCVAIFVRIERGVFPSFVIPLFLVIVVFHVEANLQ